MARIVFRKKHHLAQRRLSNGSKFSIPIIILIIKVINLFFSNILSGNHTIPPGTNLMIHIHLIQRSPEYYTNPDQFDPLRETKNPNAFLPFISGPRNCMGNITDYGLSSYPHDLSGNLQNQVISKLRF